MNDITIEKKLKNLTLLYWINMGLLLVASLFLLFNKGTKGKSMTESDFTLERFGIIFILIVIPLALKFHHTLHEKIKNKNATVYNVKMPLYFKLRLIVLDLAIIFNLVCYYYIGAMNFFYLALIGLFSFFLCYPSTNKTIN